MLGYNTVELKKGGKYGLPATSKVWPQFHFSRLRPFYDKTSDFSDSDRRKWAVAETDLVELGSLASICQSSLFYTFGL